VAETVPPAPEPPGTWRDRLELLGAAPPVTPWQVAAGAVAVLGLVLGAWLLLRQPAPPPPELVLPLAGAAETSTTSTTTPPAVVVHAAGAVRAPGVYRLAAGARVADVLDAAGGPAEGADLDRLNLAAPVVDGAQVYVPRVGEPLPAPVDGGGPAGTPTGPLDLNVATQEQLERLPGIGPATASAILAERERRGRFASVDDLLDVRGIGPAKLAALRDLVAV
jgi:competence protein ComEA